MVWIMLLVVAFVVTVVVTWLSERIRMHRGEVNRLYRLMDNVGYWSAAGTLVIALSPFFYEYPEPAMKQVDTEMDTVMVPVTFVDGQLVRHPYGCFEWPWQFTPSLHQPLCSQELSTPLMTQNPKVRKLKYDVSLTVSDPEKYFRVETRRRGGWRHQRVIRDLFQERLRFQLYELNDQRASQLVEFYNPENPEQQQAFLKAVREFLDPAFAEDGVAVGSAKFSLAE